MPRRPGSDRRRRRRGDQLTHDRRARQHRDGARPVLPGPALSGRGKRHRLPGQHRPGRTALPCAARRQGEGLGRSTLAEPTSKQRSVLQRLLRHAPRGASGDPAPRSRHRAAPLRPRSQGLDPRAQPLPRPDGQVRRLAESRKRRHSRHHHPHLGAGFRPGPLVEKRLASQSRRGQMHQHHPTSARANRSRRSAPGQPTAAGQRTARLLYTATVVED